ncbi:MAG: VWA domain-containing protein [Alphaproteobacteria bacterium]|nr:VWA domain-containing protein [Alphaproteobacteria bacterium]
MSFSLLTPLALALGALVAGPILAHMAQQRPSQRMAYGAMMLIRRLVRRLEKRRRLKDRWLLALRILAVLAMVLAAARPELSWPETSPSFGGSGAVVLVMDDSMSMGMVSGGRTLMSRARERAIALVRSLPDGAQVGLVRIGGEARRVTAALTTDHAAILADLESMEAGYGRTDLRGGLLQARALLEGTPGEVVVFTDEAGPNVVSGAAGELRRLIELGASVIPEVVLPSQVANVAVVSAEYGDGPEGGSVDVRVHNFGEADIELPATVGLPDGSEITAFLELAPDASVDEAFTVPQTVPGGVAWVRVGDEALPGDNARYFHLPRVGASRVMVIDGDPGPTPTRSEVYFLERALAPWGGRRGGVLPEVRSPPGLAELDPEVHRVVFLANVADLSAHAATLTDFVRGGGGLVISLGDNVTADRYNGALRDLLPAKLDKPRDLVDLGARDGVPLELPDLEMDLFAPFAESGRAGFTRIAARRVFGLVPYEETGWDGDGDGVRTLLRYEGGTPALVERRVGRGRVLLWTSTVDLGWCNAPLQAAFMPFVQRLVGVLGGEAGGGAEQLSVTVGEPTQVRLPVVGLEPQVTGPDGVAVFAELIRQEELEVRFVPRLPGAYTVGVEGEPPLARVAVNTPLEESDVRTGEALTEVQAEIDPSRFVRRAELGRGALALALFAVLAQALLAARGRAS